MAKNQISSSENVVPGPRFILEPMAELQLLPDDCLLNIMKYLGPVDIRNLSRVCDRIKVLRQDKSLWKKIDFRPYRLLATQLMRYLKFFNTSTTSIAIRGFVDGSHRGLWRRSVITPNSLEAIARKCPFLETFILERVVIEKIWTADSPRAVKRISLSFFPATLTCLSLSKCVVTGINSKTSYFQGMYEVIPNLKVLILSHCRWVAPHDFLAISKSPRLEELRMNSCPQLGECVAYTSLATRFGFPSLKILDLRDTRMGDSDVIAFTQTITLTHLYLESPALDIENFENRRSPFYNDDLSESSEDEDDETQMSSVKSKKIAATLNFPHTNSSPLSSPQKSQNCKRDHISPPQMNDSENGVGNGDLGLPLSSTSSESLNSAGPSPVRIGWKHIRPRKRPFGDSESSSDDDISDTEIAESSGVSTDGSSSPDKKVKNRDKSKETSCIGTKRKCQSSDTDSIHSKNNDDIVPKPIPADSYRNGSVIAGSSSSEQLFLDFPRPRPPIIALSRCPSDSEGNSGSDNEQQMYLPFYIPGFFDREDDIFDPEFYDVSFHIPTVESTITDMCVMSFVLDGNEADRVGYVRLASPQNRNVRSQLQTLVLRNYRRITDATLQYLSNSQSLSYLDVSGTSVTMDAVQQFRFLHPDIQVISDFEELSEDY